MAKKQKDQGSGYISHGRISENRRARYEYEITDTVEAGLVLMGSEVKSLRLGRANILESYAGEKNGELYLLGAEITEWQPGHPFNHHPRRPRKLLMKGKERDRFLQSVQQKGFTIVPLKLYFNKRGLVKVLLGLGKGKKTHEKRDTIKDREWKIQKERIMKHNR